jgi:hypothetical protein
MADVLSPGRHCVQADLGEAQRASFAYFGDIPFARQGQRNCDYFLLQDHHRGNDAPRNVTMEGDQWKLVWQGRRPSDRYERFRLYRRISR